MISFVVTFLLIVSIAEADPPATEGPKPQDRSEIIVNDATTEVILNDPAIEILRPAKPADPPATEGPKPEDRSEIIIHDATTEVILNDPAVEILRPAKPLNSNPEALNREFTPSGQKLWEGDMILSKEQVEGIFGRKGTRKAINDLRRRWPNGVIPYRFLPVSEPDRDVILSGLQHWMDNSCLRFYEVDANFGSPHLYFNKSSGCYSSVGMVPWQNGQEVSIGKNCEHLGTVAHEVGHAIGFYHEQSRPDRDRYVKIIESNIIPKNLFNFDLQNDVDDYGVEYDLTSLMHYGLDYFTSNGKKVMVPLDPTKEFLIGQRKALSFRDLKLASLMYKCGDRCQNKPSCQNGGFVTHTCQCRCPPEFSGSKCEVRAPPSGSSCGGKITSPRTLTSPNYPQNYPKDSRCIWMIEAPQGREIKLTMNDFDLLYKYSDNTCVWDYLEVRAGDSYDGNKYCKDDLNSVIMSVPTNKAVLVFKADYDWNKGFSMDIEFV